ncbi:hypothetical protein AJ80_03620 [Polytolypa hystricis UAMH7299]|uniref:MARVEL domain-containing protein n=1 Tax=Polytolypa hystricis (strain UAMH7299) TaxID=1447883 RepID=A0A2B7YHK6_POLH7|nr:hypothetical protein AJ80_03620 [Polytolypa hystricis UAMH7299]
MRLPHMGSGRAKMLMHSFQAFIIFLAWVLTIAIFTRDGKTDGRTAWYFALCWISIPALIYLAAIPLWPRTRRFANVYAFAALDVVYSVLWFSAWVAVATYVATGKSQGSGDDSDDDDDSDDKKTGCEAFAFGSPAKCKLSTGTVILGVFVFLLFVATSFFSIRNLMEYRRTGTMPYDGTNDPTLAAHSKAAFSSNPAAHDFGDDDDDPNRHDRDSEYRTGRLADGRSDIGGVGGGPASHRGDDEDQYALLHQTDADDMAPRPPPSYDPTAPNPGAMNLGGIGGIGGGVGSLRTPSSNTVGPGGLMHDYDTSYGGPYGSGSGDNRTQSPSQGEYMPYGR